jgi:hypothetical protein
VALDCPVQQDDKRLQQSTAPNPNGCADVARTGLCIVTVRCATGLSGAPIASILCQRLGSGWGVYIPSNHLIHWHPSLLKYSFIARAKSNTPRHNQSNQTTPSFQNQLQCLRACERITCVLLLLLSLVLSSSFLIPFLKCFVKLSKRHQVCGGPCGVLVTRVIKGRLTRSK